ncbi:MAG: hypothetical protein H6827_10645 [Planctomycetes bacterium]|nr:hypothetical protein [Planctomycetota bacterium]
MKPPYHIRTLGVLFFSAGVLLWPARAQSQAPAAAPPPQAAVPQKVRVDLDIRQGLLDGRGNHPATIARVVDVLQAQVPDANFVLSPGVSGVVVSNLTLRSADLEGALTALEFATGRKVLARQVAQDNIYAVTTGQAGQSEKGVEVFNLTPILRAMGPEDQQGVRECIKEICTVIVQTISDFDRETGREWDTPQPNFNESTRLLVIIGHPEQLEIAGKIIKALTPPAGSTGTAALAGKSPVSPGKKPEAGNPSDAGSKP